MILSPAYGTFGGQPLNQPTTAWSLVSAPSLTVLGASVSIGGTLEILRLRAVPDVSLRRGGMQ